MSIFQIVKYKSNNYQIWNHFIENSKNATFLFHRDFMEYHKDRFDDFSLMIYKGEKLLALLPANINGETVYSHQGLTYGGIVLQKHIKFKDVLEIFKFLLEYLDKEGVLFLMIKQIPSIYNELFSDELQYFMYVLKNLNCYEDL